MKPRVNVYTLNSILLFLEKQFKEEPKLEYGLPSEHFHNFCIRHASWIVKQFIDKCQRKNTWEVVNVQRIDRATIERAVKRLVIEAQHLSQETDSTCYAWEYSLAMSHIASLVEKNFIVSPNV